MGLRSFCRAPAPTGPWESKKSRPTITPALVTGEDQQVWLYKIFAILRTQIGHDVSAYKVNTLLHRINRRMGLHQIDNHEKYDPRTVD